MANKGYKVIAAIALSVGLGLSCFAVEPTSIPQNIVTNPSTVNPPTSSYSQSVRVPIGNTSLIFISGQVARDPKGNLVGKGDIRAQTEQVFRNIGAILKANNASFGDVVRETIFVTDIAQRPEITQVRKRYFTHNPPTSTFVEVRRLTSPDWLLEIEAIAVVHKGH
ncbi:MAG: RidA family protein [Terriglobia bacterium]